MANWNRRDQQQHHMTAPMAQYLLVEPALHCDAAIQIYRSPPI
jgi:hypothetical protein